MKQNTLATLLVGCLLLTGSLGATAAPTDRLITQQDAARHGLDRAWFTQIRIDPGRSRVSHVRLFEGTGLLPDVLFVQTDQAMVHALDAETGQTLWARAVGSRAQPTMPVGANAELVGVLNGSRLYLLDRSNGRILWERRVTGVPADGPVLTDKYVFVPTIGGLVLAYPIEKEQLEEEEEVVLPSKANAPATNEPEPTGSEPSQAKPAPPKKVEEPYRPFALKQQSLDPLTCVSFGQITSQPIFTLEDKKNQYLAWSTTRGLFVGYVDLRRQSEFAVTYQLRTHSEIVTQPTYLPPRTSEANIEGLIFSASKDGEVHAISATRGAAIWTYAIGQPVVEPIIPIKDRVYVATELGDFYCLDAATGTTHWSTGNVGQFIAASQQNVYVADRAGQLRVLDAASGARIDALYASDLPIKFRNLWTDRIYLATPTGLIQCLHETAQDEPLRHRKAGVIQVEAATGEEFIPAGQPSKPEEKPGAKPAPSGENPFEAPAAGADNPFE